MTKEQKEALAQAEIKICESHCPHKTCKGICTHFVQMYKKKKDEICGVEYEKNK